MSETLQVRVKSITYEAEGILSYELRPLPPRHLLPAFTAGSHVDVQLSNGLVRSYSLLNDPQECHRYVIGVNKDRNSRGGSRFLHEQVRAGDAMSISHPRNNFELAENVEHTVLIAGGIGITPLWSMIQRLERLKLSWELHFASRTRRNAAFLEQLHALDRERSDRIHLAFDGEPGGVGLNLRSIIEAAPPGAHFYCCGPLPMLQAFEEATQDRDASSIHVEYFAAKKKADTSGGFEVELARSGRVVIVQPGKTILDALLDLGVSAPYSCQEGVCGTCEIPVLAGIPDHRDLVISKAEQAKNKSIMICCSGSKSPRLVLDF